MRTTRFFIFGRPQTPRNLDEFSIPRLPVSNLKFVLRVAGTDHTVCTAAATPAR